MFVVEKSFSVDFGYHTLTIDGGVDATHVEPKNIVDKEAWVVASATEARDGAYPFIGASIVSVYNVVPQDDGTVLVRVWIQNQDPIRVLVRLFIVRGYA
jgi:hypothetical protein